MNWSGIIRGALLVFTTVILSSCMIPEKESSLGGRVYVHKKTLDRITFTKEGTVIFSWSCGVGDYYEKNHPYVFQYTLEKDGRIGVICPTSGQGRYFPYSTITFSPSKNSIYVVADINSECSGIFWRTE